MSDMPEAEEQFNAAKEATLKEISGSDELRSLIFFGRMNGLKKLGIDNDNREEMYNAIKDMTIDDLRNFFNSLISKEKTIMLWLLVIKKISTLKL